MIVTIFARNLSRAREAAQLSQSQLQQISGVTQPHISAIERGAANPTLETIGRLAEAVGVAPWQLLKPNLSDDFFRHRDLPPGGEPPP